MIAQRRGFTLIEILVTIGIILVLVGIVSVGITYVTKSGQNNSVRVTLGNLKGMVAELEATAGLNGRQPTEWAYTGNGTKTALTPGALNVWKDADPTAAGDTPLLIPKGAVITELSEGGGERYESDAVVNTQLIMQLLLASPKNKTMLGQLPAEQLMETLPGTFALRLITPAGSRTPTPPIPLDPWGNPIAFVPAAGLCGNDTASAVDSMWIGGAPNADGAKQVIAAPPVGSSTQVGPIRSPDGRPFWASAGPDGDFRTGDDNVYSFEN